MTALLPRETIHLCIDMQRLFAEKTAWHTPWMKRVLPKVARIALGHPHETIFTRFIPPADPREMPGAWQAFYERWREITTRQLDPGLLDLVPPLDRIAVPGNILDKRFFSPFQDTDLAPRLKAGGTTALVITGAETDMCVLAAVLDAVDLGFFVVLPEDALCSSSDQMHDALLSLYRSRFSQQIETLTTDEIMARWPEAIDPPLRASV